MQGYRKFTVAVLSVLCTTLAVGMGWIEGLQYASIITLVVGTYCGSNVLAKKPSSLP